MAAMGVGYQGDVIRVAFTDQLYAFMSLGSIAASLSALFACRCGARLTPVFGAIFGMAFAGLGWTVLFLALPDYRIPFGLFPRTSLGALIGCAIIGWVLMRSIMKKSQ